MALKDCAAPLHLEQSGSRHAFPKEGLQTTMSKSPHRTFTGDFKVFFLRGLAILLPSVLTIWIVVYAYQFVDTRIAQPINAITRIATIKAMPFIVRGPADDAIWSAAHYPAWYHVDDAERQAERDRRLAQKLPTLSPPALDSEIRQHDLKAWWDQHPWLNAIGLIFAVLLFYLSGRIFGGFLGRRLAARIERIVARVPIFKQVYPYVKQLVDFIFGETKLDFNRVVLIEYPRKGIWTIGFLTGHSMNDLAKVAGFQPVEMVTVFIPSSPTPFTGYTVSMLRTEVYEVNITVEEALRFTVSGGVLVPDRQMLSETAPHPEGVLRTPSVPSRAGKTTPLGPAEPPPPARL